MESLVTNAQISQYSVMNHYDIHTLRQRAHEAKQGTSKFLKKLKQRPPKNLDQQMAKLHKEVFDKTDCLQCANCCTTTGPLFTRQDIKRISKAFKMKESNFEATYLKVDEDHDLVLQSVPCTFLGYDNRCSIYDIRPKACREFPHTNRKKIYQINALTEKNVAICPAAFQIVVKMKSQLKV